MNGRRIIAYRIVIANAGRTIHFGYLNGSGAILNIS
jgi:hypothetical protein